jgi:hypothetical protein
VTSHPLVDEVERLGAIAERDELTRREAAHQLKALYPGMTIPGCYELVKEWRSVRKHYGLPGPYPEPAST